MKQGIDKQPVNQVQWIDRNELNANDYNPNYVAPPELELLKTSIKEDGWTQPIVILQDKTIVDGFHRWTISADPELIIMTDGKVPCVIVDFDKDHRMMSTIRHNRARGTHAVLKMADIVREMKQDNLSDKEIMDRLSMEEEELERLLDSSGMTIRGTKDVDGFGKSWVPTTDK
jgi:ParB-like chromosome segregation protein Spo0J